MTVYFALLLAPLAWALARPWPRWDGPAAVAIIVSLTLFIGLRREVGGDWDSYALMFWRGARQSLPVSLGLSDPGYMAVGRLAAAVGLNVAALNLLAALVFAIGLVDFCRRQASPPLALLIALPVLVLVVAMGFTRQSMALGMVMAAFSQAQMDRRRGAILFLAVAPLFHWSAVIAWPLAAGLWAGRFPPVRISIGIGLMLAGAALLLVAYGPAWVQHQAQVTVAGGSLLRAAPTLAAVVVAALVHGRLALRPGEAILLQYLSGLAAFTVVLAAMSPTLGDRFGFYTVPLQMLVFPAMLALFTNPRVRLLVTAGLCFGYVVLMGGWLILTPYRACWSPYRSYLTQPGDILLQNPAFRRDLHCLRSKAGTLKDRLAS